MAATARAARSSGLSGAQVPEAWAAARRMLAAAAAEGEAGSCAPPAMVLRGAAEPCEERPPMEDEEPTEGCRYVDDRRPGPEKGGRA